MHGYQPCHFNHQQTPKLKPLTSSTTINPPRWPPVEVGPSLKCQNRHVESYLEDPRPQGLGSWEMSWSCDSLRLPVDFTNGSRSRKGNQGFLQWRYAQTRPTFTHKFLWLWGSPHSMTQMPLLRKLRWCAHRCVPSPQDLEIWNYLCFTSESTRRWVDLRPKTPSLLCVVYHLYMLYLPFVYIYIYMYVMIYVWFDESVHTLTMGLTLQRHVALDLDLLIGEVPWNTNPTRWKKPRSRKISFVKHPSSFLTCEDCGE